MQKIRGFTLVELLVAVLIIGILSAIAIAAYTTYIRKANRIDAKNALLTMQMQEEKYRTTNNAYSGALGVGSPIRESTISDDGHYSLSISNVSASTYTLTATAIGDQLNDTDCRTFTLNQDGTRTATNSADAITTTECW